MHGQSVRQEYFLTQNQMPNPQQQNNDAQKLNKIICRCMHVSDETKMFIAN